MAVKTEFFVGRKFSFSPSTRWDERLKKSLLVVNAVSEQIRGILNHDKPFDNTRFYTMCGAQAKSPKPDGGKLA
jgi:hypothetical protein